MWSHDYKMQSFTCGQRLNECNISALVLVLMPNILRFVDGNGRDGFFKEHPSIVVL